MLHITNAEITKQYSQCKLFLWSGNLGVAKDCKNVLKDYWNRLNSGRVDVESIDHLYTKLCQCVRMITKEEARLYEINRRFE